MQLPLRHKIKIAAYIMSQRIRGNKKYPLVMMLEPLFRCNLACAGCGKIDYPNEILNRRLSVADCLSSAQECGAPMVAIAGGEPLLHREIGEITAGIIEQKRIVYLCTNALLVEKKLHLFKPSSYFSFNIHLDGNQQRHDRSVCQSGVYTRAVEAIKIAKKEGFNINVNCTLFDCTSAQEVADFFDDITALGVDGITVSPGYAYERAPDQEHFLKKHNTKKLFREIFKKDKIKKKWPLNHSILYLDFLAGNQSYKCTPWGNPTRNIFGWQRPCYLLGEGYASSFKELMLDTNWDDYGTGNYEKCADCMAHCGYEPTAVDDIFSNPFKGLSVWLKGIKKDGKMAPEIRLDKQRKAELSIFDEHVKIEMEKIYKNRLNGKNTNLSAKL